MAKKKTTRKKAPARKPAPRKAARKARVVKASLPRAPKGGKASGPKPPTDITSVRHADKRKNIPTEELRDFVKDEDAPKAMLYPRNPDLDPQLVWRGKDEQDREDLSVPLMPIYIQEKIHPQAIVEDFRREVAKPKDIPQLDLFHDFNGLPEDFNDRVDFYTHDANWSNRMILGDSLLVMSSLAEKEGLKGRVQCVYFDPPYGIKFGSNWQVSTRKRDVKDGKSEHATRQPEQIRAFRDTWELGIHSYLAYIRDRLTAARDMLTESGSIFVQIGDENVHLVRALLEEVFGVNNFCAQIAFSKTTSQTSELLSPVMDYLLWFCRNREAVKYRSLYKPKPMKELVETTYKKIELPDGRIRSLTAAESLQPELLDRVGRLMCFGDMVSQSGSDSTRKSFSWGSREYVPRSGGWKTNSEGLQRLAWADRLGASGPTLLYKRYFDDFAFSALGNLWDDTQLGGFLRDEQKVYVVQTGLEVVKRALLMTTDPGDLVLDPTCGSGTTAHVAEQWGRRWITIDTSRVALALARTRLMTARFPYYLLADSPEGRRKERELVGGAAGADPQATPGAPDVRKGFVYKRVPHVTLKSIANNPDIREGMTRAEIDAAIARHADTELLFDKPYDDPKRLRVTGPFTVESLSPHRTISAREKAKRGAEGIEGVKVNVIGPDDFGRLVLDHMRKAGVQNTFKDERLTFESLEPYAGEWIQGSGSSTDKEGKTRKIAVCIGPEHGTVGPMMVKEAAKEAVRGVGFDMLLVAGFAFDPHVGEEAKRYGKLAVLPVRINADLAMGELLKKTGAGNLFMIFGEPDITIRPAKKDETLPDGLTPKDATVVEIHGLDVYDPTTGDIRPSSTDDIACWFIDTNYNDESFFVRHAYFTGADEPYEKLKRALKAEVDEAAWSALYSTVSRPFPKPKTGKIAVKVINHYGDEVLQVYSVK